MGWRTLAGAGGGPGSLTPPLDPAENGFLPRALGGNLIYIGATTPGQVLQWDGAAWNVGTLGLGVVHSSAAGAFTSSLLVDADVAAAAAIAGTKISPDFGSQNVQTTGTLQAGAGTLTGLTVSSLGLGVVHSSAGGAFTSSLLVNADVAAAAAIAGTKISPDFGAQLIQSTVGIAFGAAPATTGTVRLSATGSIFGRNAANTVNLQVLNWDAASSTIRVGELGVAGAVADALYLDSRTDLRIRCGAGASAASLILTTTTLTLSSVTAVSFSNVASAQLGIGQTTTANTTAPDFTVHGSQHRGDGTVFGGAVVVNGGDTSQNGTTGQVNGTAGPLTVRGGDATNATTTNVAAPVLVRGGRGTGTGAVDANVAIHAGPASYQSMQRGLFVGDSAAPPTAAPAAGLFAAARGGAWVAYGSGKGVTTMSAAGSGAIDTFIPFHTAPLVSQVATSGAVTSTAASRDLSSSSAPLGAWDNVGLTATALIEGWTAAGNYCRLTRQRSFSRLAGTTAPKDAVTNALGVDFADAALVGVAATLDNSGDTVRVRVTGVGGQDIKWTVQLSLSSTGVS